MFHQINSIYQRVSNTAIGHVLDSNLDVIVITGGSQGLGHQLAVHFAATKTPVCVIDKKEPEEAVPGVTYYFGDVTNPEDLQTIEEQIRVSIGSVTVVVNNAAIVKGGSLTQTSFEEIDSTIRVNLNGAMFVTKVFLPNMLAKKRGYVVTIASTLGHIAPARLSSYAASKSGLIAFHEALTFEVGPPSESGVTGMKTLLVCPGQLSSGMFTDVESPSKYLAFKLNPEMVAKKIVRSVKHGHRGQLIMPWYGYTLPIFRALPWPITELARKVSGIDKVTLVYD